MNVATRWVEDRIDDETVRFISEHTFGGRREVTARRVVGLDGEPRIEWTNKNDASYTIEDRAHRVLGVPL